MKRIIQAGVASLGIAALLTACSTPGGSDNSGGGTVPADGTAEIQSDQLTVWVNPSDPAAVMNVWERFSAETGVEVEIIEMPADQFESGVQTRWAAGERPDILEYHATSLFWALNPEENMYDLSNMPFVEREQDILEFAASLNGKVYAAVTDSPSLFGIFYNKQVFADNGLEVPETFEDLADICSGLQGTGINPIWEAGGSAWPTQILPGLMYLGSAQLDGNWAQQVIDQETTFDAEGSPFIEGMTWYKQFQDDGCFNSDAVTATFEQGIASVAEGSTAMIALPTGLIDQFTDRFGGDVNLTNETIGFAYPSADEAVSAWAPNVAGTWYVPKTGDSERESTALAFIQWATGEGYQDFVDEAGTFPVLDGAESPEIVGFRAEVRDAYQDSTAYAFNSNLIGFNSEFPNYVTGMLAGTVTPEDAASSAQIAFEQAARAAGLPGW